MVASRFASSTRQDWGAGVREPRMGDHEMRAYTIAGAATRLAAATRGLCATNLVSLHLCAVHCVACVRLSFFRTW